MAFSFRIRFILPENVAFGIDSHKWIIESAESINVVLCSAHKDVLIKDANKLVVRGNGYSTKNEALIAGNRYREMFMLTCAYLRVGADFGDRAAKGHYTEHGLEWLERQKGGRVLNDEHGLMTFKTEPTPHFASLEMKFVLTKPQEKLAKAIKFLKNAQIKVTDREHLAFDLFSGSFFQPSADTRFLMLMMAIETLLNPSPRSEVVQELVHSLINQTENCSKLSKSEKDSLLGSLQGLLSESIGQAGRRFVERLGDRKYDGYAPKQFFTRCYRLRSQLVHGHVPRPSFEEVGRIAAILEGFVGDLLCGPLLLSEQPV